MGDFFENKLQDYDPKSEPLDQNNKFFNGAKFKNYENLIWNKSFKNFVPENDYSVYTGSAGIALLKLRYANTKSRDEQISILQEARKLIPTGINKRGITFLCGNSGPLAIAAVIEHKLGNTDLVISLVTRIIDLGSNLESSIPNELLYGRIGYLFSLLFLKKHIQDVSIPDRFIETLIESILELGRNSSNHLMYEWHDKKYLGAAHGLSGICYILLQAREYISRKNLDVIRSTIDYLTTLKFLSKNYPSSLGNNRDTKVQWCHGAPGFTHLFCLASQVYNEPKYLTLALECGDVIWERGLLTKGYSLCHGVAGNAYSFLELYKATKDEKHLHRAIQFGEWIVSYKPRYEQRYPDRPLSLYEGLAGRLYFIIDIQEPVNSKFPGYEL